MPSVVEREIVEGKEISDNEVNWEGKLLRTGALAVDFSSSGEGYVYPGNRSLASYEGGEVEQDKGAMYTFESLVFSFVLLVQLGRDVF